MNQVGTHLKVFHVYPKLVKLPGVNVNQISVNLCLSQASLYDCWGEMQQSQVPDCSRRLHALDVGTLGMTGTYIVTAQIAMLHRQLLFSFTKKPVMKHEEIFTCTILFLSPVFCKNTPAGGRTENYLGCYFNVCS